MEMVDLTPSQRLDVMRVLAEEGLDPNAFAWAPEVNPCQDDYPYFYVLRHAWYPCYYRFDYKRGEHVAICAVGTGTNVRNTTVRTFAGHFDQLRGWAKDVKAALGVA